MQQTLTLLIGTQRTPKIHPILMYKGFVQVWIKIDVNLAVAFDMKLCLNHNEELHQP